MAFIHEDPTLTLDATSASVVTNGSNVPGPLWGFDSIGYLDVVDPSWLEGNSYPCLATGFVPSVVTTSASSCDSPSFLSSITESLSTPEYRWQAFCSSDGHPQLELPSPTFSVNSSTESDLPNCSPNTVGPFSDFLVAEVMLDDDNDFSPEFQYNSSASSFLGNSLGGTFPPARFQPPPSVYPKKASCFARRKGLAGWGDTTNMQVYSTLSFPLNTKRRRSSLSSPSGSLRAFPRRLSKRTRREPNPSATASGFLIEDEHASQVEDDSEDYRPSPSPSPSSPPPISPLPNDSRTASKSRRRGRRICNSTKTKTTGSAAFALALVTHASEAKREEPSCQDLEHDWPDPFKKRKNQPIPIPVPVANLNKKSRGRKVPSVSVTSRTVTAAPVKMEEEDVQSDGSGWAARINCESASNKDHPAGSRTFVCVIPGCGKCFVRSEHLKRHVRSIHTHDKPHVCPFDGCDKSFSRRDNLGQHVRVHLQP